MDPQIIAAIIGGVATVVAAVVAAVLDIRAGRRRGGTDSGVASTQESPPREATPPKQSSRELDATEGPPAKKEPQTHVVDPVEGDFATISEAIRAAAPKDKILVRPGWYREGLVVDKPLDIADDGRSEDIVVLGDGKSALQFSVPRRDAYVP